jgi:Lrp/AsnC family leucine-responsive transcriptional regulator
MSYADLARETGLSTSAVHQRVRRLEERGVITGYRAVVDPRAIGLPLTALIDLTPLDPSAPDDIPQRVESFEEIESCWSVAGSASYVVKVRVAEPTDLEDLRQRASRRVRPSCCPRPSKDAHPSGDAGDVSR